MRWSALHTIHNCATVEEAKSYPAYTLAYHVVQIVSTSTQYPCYADKHQEGTNLDSTTATNVSPYYARQ